ncbi:DUF6538 domain-containing protein [Acetobacter okinawensis]|uniref:DUF6538 domain-containing protein n=1 Tax=Acetobacter okinawensis TaxID=1076594 RepID=UPI0034E1F250
MLRLIGSHYHFRRAVPQAVQACLGRTEISLSLAHCPRTGGCSLCSHGHTV